MTDWRPVAQALLGSWPQQVTSWGREGLAAYLAELEARGISPEAALQAIRSWPAGSDFPPSAPNLAARARGTRVWWEGHVLALEAGSGQGQLTKGKA